MPSSTGYDEAKLVRHSALFIACCSILCHQAHASVQEPRDLVEMLALRMGFLFDSMLKDERLLRVAMQLLSNVSVGPQFAHVLLTFLVDQQLPSVQQPDSKVSMLASRISSAQSLSGNAEGAACLSNACQSLSDCPGQ